MRALIKKKSFGEKIIFQDAVFSVREGSRTAVVGPSGAGKTTLMRILSGLDHDYAGRIEGAPEHPVILFQEDRLSEHIAVLPNLMAVTDSRSEAISILGELSLSGEEHTPIKELSGGMKRRVAIARALLVDTDCLFLDEPFRGLDDDARRLAASLILRREEGKTIVFITHSEEELSLLHADDIIRVGC